MSTPFLRNGVLVLGVKKTRRVTTDYTLQATDSEVLVDGRLQAVNIAFPAVETLVMSSYWTITIEQWGMGVAVNGQAVTVDTQKVVVFFNRINKEFNMTFIQQTRTTGSKVFKGEFATAPASPATGDEFKLTADATIGGVAFYKGEILTYDGTKWTSNRIEEATDDYSYTDEVGTTFTAINGRDVVVNLTAVAANTSVTLPAPVAANVGRTVSVFADFATGKTCKATAATSIIKAGDTASNEYVFATSGDSLLLQVVEISSGVYNYVAI